MEEFWFENPTLSPQQLPQLEETPFLKLQPDYQILMMISRGILGLILLIGGIVLLSVNGWWLRPGIVLAVLGGWALVTVLLILIARKSFSYKAYALRAKDITYKSGWIWRNTTTVPFSRVQHCEVSEGPIERSFGLAELKVYTAGGQSSDLSLPGLSPDEALRLKSYITQKAAEDEHE